MSLSAPFIQRPVATTLLALGIAISGIFSFQKLPVAPLPQIEFPTISVQASLPGASPEIMATAVATPLEREFSRIAGITEITSSSSLGNTNVTVQFDLSRNIDGAARDVQSAINAARSQLPNELPSNPTYRKVNPADAPIMILSLTSEVFSKGEMYDVASTILQQKLSQVEGVGQVIVGGSSLPAIRVELNPTTLNKYGVNLEDVRHTLANANTTRPKGQILSGNQFHDILTNDQLFQVKDYESLIVRYHQGTALKIADVAEVQKSVEDLRNAGVTDGKSSVLLIIFKQPGANVIETVDRIYDIIPQLKASIPKAIEMLVTLDRTTVIRASLFDVELTLLLSIFLVILVNYSFLGNIRAAYIPSVTVPLSLLGTFGVMYLLGYSLDNLSMMALTIATGFVVDDTVVVLENISRHIEKGMKPLKAALLGAQEVGFTVVSMSMSLIAVFIPILMMGGIVGRLFREFAVTLSVAILVSLVVSLTVTPMLCARILKTHGAQKIEEFLFVEHLKNFYGRTVSWVLNHNRLTLLVTFLTIVLNIYLYAVTPKGFFPQQDTGRIMASIQAQQDISFQSIRQKLSDFVDILMHDPDVQHVNAFVGGTFNISNAGRMFIALKPHHERKESVEKIMERLRPKLAVVPGATLFLQPVQDLVIGGRLNSAQFQYTLSAYDLETLNTWVPRIMKKMSEIPGIIDVNSDQLTQGLQAFVKIDRDTASRFGFTAQQIDNLLYDAFGQRQVSTLYTMMNQYHVVMEVAPRYWQRPEVLQDIYLQSPQGQPVPLSAFASYEPSFTLLSVNHQGQLPSATLSFNLIPGTALGDAVDQITQVVDEMHMPKSRIQGSFQGTAEAFKKSLANEPTLILITLLAVYIVLGILYESLIHPITILSTLPSAGVGALLALQLVRMDLSIIALIGIILLIGIVKKNAIMMIDFALQLERNQNKSSRDAIYEACLMRFRPIMMTTMAALLSAFPLAIGFGVGSELRQPLGVSIIGGLIMSQLLTLYTTPVIYLELENFRLWVKQLPWLTYRFSSKPQQ